MAPSRQFQHAPLGRERVHFHGRKIHLERRKKLARLLQFLRPLDQLPHPRDALIVVGRYRPPILVLPVRRNAFFRDAVHVLRANLNFKRLPAVNDRRVQTTGTDSAVASRCNP